MTLVCLPGPLGFLWALRLLSLHPGPGYTNGSVAHVLYCAATVATDPVMPRPGVVFQGLCQLDVFPASAVCSFRPSFWFVGACSDPDRHRDTEGLAELVCSIDARPVPLEERSERVFWKTCLARRSPCAPTALLQLCLYQFSESAARGFRWLRVHSRLPLGSPCSCVRLRYRPPNCTGSVLILCRRRALGLAPKAAAPPSCWADRSMAVLRARRSGSRLVRACFACFLRGSCRLCLRGRAGFWYARRHRGEKIPRPRRVLRGDSTPDPAGYEVEPND